MTPDQAMQPPRAAVIGYGSIGMRHARLLAAAGCDTAVVSGRRVEFPKVFDDVATALARHAPQYVVIANATASHHATLLALAQQAYAGTVMIEKPLFDHPRDLPSLPFARVFVAYNLRFHPLLQRLRSLLQQQRIVSVQAYAGQYLPQWRAADYRDSYSASAARGGGVLRDLSHELDYLCWLLGGWQRVSALGGRYSSLEIDSDDVFALLLATPRCPVVTVQVNYLDRMSRRSVLVNTEDHTLELDLVRGTLTIDREVESGVVERDFTYRAMHAAALRDEAQTLCTLAEGESTMQLIAAAESAVRHSQWVTA